MSNGKFVVSNFMKEFLRHFNESSTEINNCSISDYLKRLLLEVSQLKQNA